MPFRFHVRTLAAVVTAVGLALTLSACGGDEEKDTGSASGSGSSASANPDTTEGGSAAPDARDADSDTDEQVVCNLFSNEEIREATGFEVVAVEGNTMALPTCEWELSIPDTAGPVAMPLLSIVLLPESEYRNRVDPVPELLTDVDGPADEIKMQYTGGDDTGIPTRATFFALRGDQGIHILVGFGIGQDEATTTSALLDLTSKAFDRI